MVRSGLTIGIAMRAVLTGYVLWMAFIVSWYVAMLWTGKARSRGTAAQSIGYTAGFAVGFVLLFLSAGASWRSDAPLWPAPLRPLWRDPGPIGGVLVAAELVSFAFAWWARVHLGRLWSGFMTLRQGHRVVDSGPYAIVRHPIYTGFIAAGWCFALLLAAPVALAGAAVLTGVMAVKARAEEALLRRELGSAAYDNYARRVPRLIPFGPR